jgi:hypothetical protein
LLPSVPWLRIGIAVVAFLLVGVGIAALALKNDPVQVVRNLGSKLV